MTGTLMQVHAAPDELLDELIPKWLEGVECHLVAERLAPL